MDKQIEDINLNLLYQNDMLKKELMDKNHYIETLQNELNTIKNELGKLHNIAVSIQKLREESEKLKTDKEEKTGKETKSYFSYLYSFLK